MKSDYGMSLRQYAAIQLKVPDSGIVWLNEMIKKAKRDEFAEKTLAGWLASFGEQAGPIEPYDGMVDFVYKIADCMLSKSEKF